MNKIVEFISEYVGRKDLEYYKILTRRDPGYNIYDVNIARMAVFHDSMSRPRSIDMKQI